MAHAVTVLVVGEAPSRWMERVGITHPLPLAGRELAQLAGLRWPEQWLERFEPVNVLDRWPGKQQSGKGDEFPLSLAKPMAQLLLGAHAQNGRRYVLLGRRVERAFDLAEQPWFRWRPMLAVRSDGLAAMEVATAPHPSHVSHWWNSPGNRELARKFWKEAACNTSEARASSAAP